MKKLLRLFVIFLFSIPNGIHAQKIDSVNLLLPTAKKIKMKTFTFPAVFLTYGLISIENDELKSLNLSTKNELKEHFPFFKSNLDNYTQFLPAITVFSLNAMGIKGEHDLKDAALIYAGTIAVNTASVFPMKQLVHELRPDNSGYTSFPSGHTATAFASAEFLRREYGKKYPWLAVAGYAVAAGTGAYRMLNNKHWFSDVLAGAGIGIASADLVYWFYDKVGKHGSSTVFYPAVTQHSFGLGVVTQFKTSTPHHSSKVLGI